MNDFYTSNLVLIQSTLTGLVLALSIQVPLRMGVFSFAGAGSYGIGAYLSAMLVLRQDMTALPTIAITILFTGAVGLVLGLVVNKLTGLYLAMATVAFDLIITVIANNGGEWTGNATGLYGVITDFTMSTMFTITIVALLLVALSERGRVGRRIDAVREDPELGASTGVKVRRYRLAAFVISGALGGLAGSMNVLVRSAIAPPDIGFHLIVLALTMIVVGGSLSWKGAVIGAIIFTWLPDVLTVIGDWQEVVYGFIVAVAAIFIPRGIYGLWVDFRRWLRRRLRDDAQPPSLVADDDSDGASAFEDALAAESSTSLVRPPSTFEGVR